MAVIDSAPVAERARLLSDAAAALVRAERCAQVTIRLLETAPAQREACRLWNRVWDREGAPLISAELVRALAHSGNYVVGAYQGDDLVGAALGFYAGGETGSDHLHSHVAGVAAPARGRGVGFALKVHQRLWALERGLDRVTWTYDPLVRPNAVFNLAKLGAEGVEYLVHFYGGMTDVINDGDETDRVLVSWDLTHPRVAAAAGGTPPGIVDLSPLIDAGASVALDVGDGDAPRVGAAGGEVVLCRVPPDIVTLRRRDPALAMAWRVSLRAVLVSALACGLRVRAITRDGCYVLSARDLRSHGGEGRRSLS